jgi:hypothetical protein
MPPTEFRLKLIEAAAQECSDLVGTSRGDPRLRQRIRSYYEKLSLPVPTNVDKAHYSAVFISWCMRKAGATAEEFPTTEAHSEYVCRAIEAEPGAPFRAHRIEDYAPAPGDIVHFNRDGRRITFERAQEGHYKSESGIVLEMGRNSEGRHATLTVGNDPAGTVARHQIGLTESGLIRQREVDPIICVIEVAK